MEQSPSWKANSSSTSQEITRILLNPFVRYRIHKTPTPVTILNQINPVHVSPAHFLMIYFNTIIPSTPRSSKCLPFTQTSPPKPSIHHSSPTYVLHARPSQTTLPNTALCHIQYCTVSHLIFHCVTSHTKLICNQQFKISIFKVIICRWLKILFLLKSAH
jgi:hypothetical protein